VQSGSLLTPLAVWTVLLAVLVAMMVLLVLLRVHCVLLVSINPVTKVPVALPVPLVVL